PSTQAVSLLSSVPHSGSFWSAPGLLKLVVSPLSPGLVHSRVRRCILVAFQAVLGRHSRTIAYGCLHPARQSSLSCGGPFPES
ncbi:hypothetical protein EXIGLDRAFT_716974, partial [Exidia glandulosa HHB12029]